MTALHDAGYTAFDGYVYVARGEDWMDEFANAAQAMDYFVDSLGPPYRLAMAEEATRLCALPEQERLALFLDHTYTLTSEEVEEVFARALTLLGLPPLDA